MAITTFANTTTQNALTALDANFQTPVTIGTTTVTLGNTVTNLSGLGNVNSASILVNTATPGGWTGASQFEAKGASTNTAVSAYTTGTGTAFVARVDNTVAPLATWAYNGSTVGSVTTNGTGVVYATSSDVRLKDNITDAPGAGYVLDQLKVRSWDWKATGQHEDFGFIAQELVTAYPPAVQVGDADPKNITKQWGRDDSKLVPLLVKEVQSLRARVTALENK